MSFASLIESQTHFKLKDNEEYQKKLSLRNTYKDLYDDLYLDVESTLDNEYDTYYSEEFIANIQSNLQSCARRMAWIATSLNNKKEELKVINKKFF